MDAFCEWCSEPADIDWHCVCGWLHACAFCYGQLIYGEVLAPPCPRCGLRVIEPANLDYQLMDWFDARFMRELAHA